MSPIPLGIFAVSGAAPTGTFEHIQTWTHSTDVSTVTFSDISSLTDYKHLEIRFSLRSTVIGSAFTNFTMTFNGITTNSYWWRRYWASQTTGTSSQHSGTGITFNSAVMNAGESSRSGVGIISIYDFLNSNKRKTVRAFHGGMGEADSRVQLRSGFLNNNDAISSISFTIGSGNFRSGSRISIYGIRG